MTGESARQLLSFLYFFSLKRSPRLCFTAYSGHPVGMNFLGDSCWGHLRHDAVLAGGQKRCFAPFSSRSLGGLLHTIEFFFFWVASRHIRNNSPPLLPQRTTTSRGLAHSSSWICVCVCVSPQAPAAFPGSKWGRVQAGGSAVVMVGPKGGKRPGPRSERNAGLLFSFSRAYLYLYECRLQLLLLPCASSGKGRRFSGWNWPRNGGSGTQVDPVYSGGISSGWSSVASRCATQSQLGLVHGSTSLSSCHGMLGMYACLLGRSHRQLASTTACSLPTAAFDPQ